MKKKMKKEDEDLKAVGWSWTTDPDGKMFYFNKGTGEKSWTTPLRVEEVVEEPEEPRTDEKSKEEQKRERKRLYGKQAPSKYYLKSMNIEGIDEDDEDEVTKTVSLQEVYQSLDLWIPGMKGELESQYAKECLIPKSLEEVKELQRSSSQKVKILPSKLVATKKKKPNTPVKYKARLVACGNKDEDESEKDTYAGGADATSVRSAIKVAAMRNWQIRTKDVSTAFLNAPYQIEGEVLYLIPPKVFVKAGLIKDNEVWQVNKAIYGLKEAPLLWAKERDRCLKLMNFKVKKTDEEETEEFFLKKLETDVNTWHILKKGEEEVSKGVLLTYVDDIMVITEERVNDEVM